MLSAGFQQFEGWETGNIREYDNLALATCHVYSLKNSKSLRQKRADLWTEIDFGNSPFLYIFQKQISQTEKNNHRNLLRDILYHRF